MDDCKNVTTKPSPSNDEEAQGNPHDDTDKGALVTDDKNLESKTSSSYSDFDFEYTCEICDKTFSGLKPLRQHERSAKHTKQVRKKKTEKEMISRLDDHSEDEFDISLFAVCNICNKQFAGPESFKQHLIGRRHKKKMAASKLLDQLRNDDGHISLEKLKQREKERKKTTKKTPTVVSRYSGYDETHKSGSTPKLLDQLEEGNGQSQQKASKNTEKDSPLLVVGASGCTGSYDSEDSSDDRKITENEEFQCADCQKAFTGVRPWYEHMTSKTHKRTLQQKWMLQKLLNDEATSPLDSLIDKHFLKEDGDVLVCDLCHTSFTGPESASTHLKSKGHANKLEKLEYKKKFKEIKREAEGKKKTHIEPSSMTEDRPLAVVEEKGDLEHQDLQNVPEMNQCSEQESPEITKENKFDAHRVSSAEIGENKTEEAILKSHNK